MIDLDEINKTILQLEERDTTYATCEKLADLYIVRDHYGGQRLRKTIPADSSRSEFLQAVIGKDGAGAWEVMDELMETLKVVNPKVYVSVMRKLENV